MFYQTISLDCIKKNTQLQIILLNQQLMFVILLHLCIKMSLLKKLRDILKSLLEMYLIKKKLKEEKKKKKKIRGLKYNCLNFLSFVVVYILVAGLSQKILWKPLHSV